MVRRANQRKYAAVNIPAEMLQRIDRIVKRDNDFKSAADYVTFVLRELVISHSAWDIPGSFTSADLEMLRNRFVALRASEGDFKPKVYARGR